MDYPYSGPSIWHPSYANWPKSCCDMPDFLPHPLSHLCFRFFSIVLAHIGSISSQMDCLCSEDPKRHLDHANWLMSHRTTPISFFIPCSCRITLHWWPGSGQDKIETSSSLVCLNDTSSMAPLPSTWDLWVIEVAALVAIALSNSDHHTRHAPDYIMLHTLRITLRSTCSVLHCTRCTLDYVTLDALWIWVFLIFLFFGCSGKSWFIIGVW